MSQIPIPDDLRSTYEDCLRQPNHDRPGASIWWYIRIIERVAKAEAQIKEMQWALGEALIVLESIEAKTLIGHEGCLWPAEIVRAALAATQPAPQSTENER